MNPAAPGMQNAAPPTPPPASPPAAVARASGGLTRRRKVGVAIEIVLVAAILAFAATRLTPQEQSWGRARNSAVAFAASIRVGEARPVLGVAGNPLARAFPNVAERHQTPWWRGPVRFFVIDPHDWMRAGLARLLLEGPKFAMGFGEVKYVVVVSIRDDAVVRNVQVLSIDEDAENLDSGVMLETMPAF